MARKNSCKTYKYVEYAYRYNSDYDEDAIQTTLVRFGTENVPNPPFLGVITSEKDFKKFLKIAFSCSNRHEAILDEKCKKKWITPQGGSFSKEQLLVNMENYTHPTVALKRIKRTLRGDVMMQLASIRPHYPISSFVCENPRELFGMYKGSHRSTGGITYQGDRRKNVTVAIKKAMENPIAFDGVIAGMRYKDSKYRNIFMDSDANYFREARVLRKLFKAWEDLPFDHHYSNDVLAKKIVRFNAQYSFAADCEGMDFHFNWESFETSLDLICDIANCSCEQRNYIKWVCEELMWLDVYASGTVYVGEKSLLSGLFPTHHIEGILTFAVNVSVFTSAGYTLCLAERKLRKNEFTVLVCGDDSGVLAGSAPTEDVKARIVEVWRQLGQVVNYEKVEESTESLTFCKRTFALRYGIKGFTCYEGTNIPISKYPVGKCVNALFQPENLPQFSSKRLLILWFATIMDNAIGNTTYKSVVISIVKSNLDLFKQVCDITDADRVEYDTWLSQDWYIREFGIPTSHTLQLIVDTVSGKY